MKNKSTRIYIRVSTERQIQEAYSVSVQINLINFFKVQEWTIFDIYVVKK